MWINIYVGDVGCGRIGRGEWCGHAGVAGVVGPTICCYATSNLKPSILVGTRRHRLRGSFAALLIVAIGMGIVYHFGFWLGVFGHNFSGVLWCLVGLFAGWIAATRSDGKRATTGDRGRGKTRIPDH